MGLPDKQAKRDNPDCERLSLGRQDAAYYAHNMHPAKSLVFVKLSNADHRCAQELDDMIDRLTLVSKTSSPPPPLPRVL